MANNLHTQLIDTRDLVEALRAMTVSAGDDGLIHLTGTLLDRLLRTITDGLDGCIDTLEAAGERLRAAQPPPSDAEAAMAH